MRPTNRQKALLLVVIILMAIVAVWLTRNVKDPTVETMGLEATTVNTVVDFEQTDLAVSTTTTSTTTTTTVPPTTTTVPVTTTTTVSPPPTSAPIVEEANSGVDWYAVAMCESSLGTGAPQWGINTGNGYYGGLQFSHSTWIAYGGGKYSSDAHLTSAANQIAVASGMSLSHWPICGRYG